MTLRVEVSAAVLDRAHQRFGATRSVDGRPSEYDFVSGPLAAALFAFKDFDALSYDFTPSVRWYTVVDPIFGPVTFVGALLTGDVVEIVGYEDDPDYWARLDDIPD